MNREASADLILICQTIDYYNPFERVGGQVHIFTSPAVLVVCNGIATVVIGEKKIELSRGWILLLPAGARLMVEAGHAEQALCQWCLLSYEVRLPEHEAEEAELPTGAFHCSDQSLLQTVIKLYELWSHKHTGATASARLHGSFNLWVADIWQRFAESNKIVLHLDQLGYALESVLAYIHNHVADKLTREDAAQLSGLSLRSFTTHFRQRTGISFNAYVNRLRINKSIELLLLRTYSLSEIAQRVGYADEFYLSRKFKLATGYSPTSYVKQTKRIASLDHAYAIDLLALGIVPCVAVTNDWLEAQLFSNYGLHDCTTVAWGTPKAKVHELLREAKPDIIFASAMGVIERDELMQIAPVIELPWQKTSWREHFLIIAKLTDRRTEAEHWLAAFTEKCKSVRQRLDKLIASSSVFSIVNVRSDSLLLYASMYMGADLLYNELRLNAPPLVADMRRRGLENLYMTEEQIHLADADYIFLCVENSAEAKHRAQRLIASSDWQELGAACNQHVYIVEMSRWYGYAPAALNEQLDDFVQHVLNEAGS